MTRPVLKDDAGRAVKEVEGVTSIVNNIEVLPLSGTDDQTRRAVYRAIYGDPMLSTRYGYQALPSIHIIVKNGNVAAAYAHINGTHLSEHASGHERRRDARSRRRPASGHAAPVEADEILAVFGAGRGLDPFARGQVGDGSEPCDGVRAGRIAAKHAMRTARPKISNPGDGRQWKRRRGGWLFPRHQEPAGHRFRRG